jgi:hypothetical protein
LSKEFKKKKWAKNYKKKLMRKMTSF